MQFLELFFTLSIFWKIVFVFTLLVITLWIYGDSSKRGLTGLLWAVLVFIFPIVLPVYILIRPRYFIAFCARCHRIMPQGSLDCYFCEKEIPLEGGREDFKDFLWNCLLNINRLYHSIIGISLFSLKRKFLPLYFNLVYYYPWRRYHQIVITEGREKDIPINTLTYGETPFFSAWRIFELAHVKKKDIFYDVGSGTGNVVFLCNILYGIDTVGLEAIDSFIKYSNEIKKNLSFNKVNFIHGNFLDTDFSGGTIFFIVTTAFDPDTIKKLAHKFSEVPTGTRIITVTHKFNVPYLQVKGMRRVFFSWGYENVYLHEKV